MVTNISGMSALTNPKGPLPSRVYWFRRSMLLAVVFLVVFATARLLGDSSDADSDGSVAPASAETTGSQEASAESGDAETEESPGVDATSSAAPTPTAAAKPRKKTPPPLPTPTGVCDNSDVVITPVVPAKRTTSTVPITLVLRTKTTEACTWQVSPGSVTVRIDSGSREDPDEIWHTRHCPNAVPTRDVIVYQQTDTEVAMTWNGRRSDAECSNTTDWARKGWYHVNAAAYAGEPTSVQFELRRPSAVTVTQTVQPKPKKKAAKKKSASTPKPSGAVEPDL